MARILIVDNDERIVELSAWFLRRLGHVVDTANSYSAARLLLGECWPELMLADLDLGQERGQEELPKLANEGRLPATLVVSGFLDAELDSRLRRIPGVVGTVAKPVDLKQLEGLIRHHLETSPKVPAPRVTPAPATSPEPATAGPADTGDAEDDGWVEIAPLAPGIDPAPDKQPATWGSPSSGAPVGPAVPLRRAGLPVGSGGGSHPLATPRPEPRIAGEPGTPRGGVSDPRTRL